MYKLGGWLLLFVFAVLGCVAALIGLFMTIR